MLPRPHLWLNTARRFLPVECCSKKKVTERKRKEKEHKTNGRRSPPNSKQEKNALQTKKGDFLIKQPSKKNVTRERDGKKWKSKKENGRQEAWPGASGNAIVIDSLAETIVVIQLNIPINEVAYRDLSNYRRAIRFLLFIDSVPLFHGSQPNRPDRVRRFRFIHSALIEFRGGPPPNSMAPIIDRLNRWNSIVYPPSSFHFGIVCVFFVCVDENSETCWPKKIHRVARLIARVSDFDVFRIHFRRFYLFFFYFLVCVSSFRVVRHLLFVLLLVRHLLPTEFSIGQGPFRVFFPSFSSRFFFFLSSFFSSAFLPFLSAWEHLDGRAGMPPSPRSARLFVLLFFPRFFFPSSVQAAHDFSWLALVRPSLT